MKARGDLDRSGVSEVMDSVKRKVKDENLTDRKSFSSDSGGATCAHVPDSTRTDHHEENRHSGRIQPVPRTHIDLHSSSLSYSFSGSYAYGRLAFRLGSAAL